MTDMVQAHRSIKKSPVILRTSRMFDDFFTRAVVGGVGLALFAGPLGGFIVWRRLAYFGDTFKIN